MKPKKAHHTLSPEAMQLIAKRFKIMGEPMRLQILHALQGGEQTVTELVNTSQSTQANISKHLALLIQAGLLNRRREGVYVYYFISDPVIFELCELMCSSIRNHHEQAQSHLPRQGNRSA